MPYIQQYKRDNLIIDSPGQLNYEIHVLIDSYLEEKGDDKYQTYNDVIGALECVKHELYRRLVAPLEDKKIEENGDVPPYAKKNNYPTYEVWKPKYEAKPLKDDCAIDLKKHCEWYGLDSDDAKSELLREIDALRPGWWRVDGVRHTAFVKAIDETEAVLIAEEKELVQDWECGVAHYLGKDLPPAFS